MQVVGWRAGFDVGVPFSIRFVRSLNAKTSSASLSVSGFFLEGILENDFGGIGPICLNVIRH